MRRTKQDLLCLEKMNTGRARLYEEYHSPHNDCEDRVSRFREFGWLHEDSLSLNNTGVGIADLVHYLRHGGDGTDLIDDVGVPKTVEFAEFTAPDQAFQMIQRLKEFGYTAGEDYQITEIYAGGRDFFTLRLEEKDEADEIVDILKPINWVDTRKKKDSRFNSGYNPRKVKIML